MVKNRHSSIMDYRKFLCSCIHSWLYPRSGKMVENKNEEAGEEQASEGSGDGDKPKTPQTIVDANAAAERMEEANKKTEELIERQEDFAAARAIDGKAEAGQGPAKKTPETDEEYVEKFKHGEVSPFKE